MTMPNGAVQRAQGHILPSPDYSPIEPGDSRADSLPIFEATAPMQRPTKRLSSPITPISDADDIGDNRDEKMASNIAVFHRHFQDNTRDRGRPGERVESLLSSEETHNVQGADEYGSKPRSIPEVQLHDPTIPQGPEDKVGDSRFSTQDIKSGARSGGVSTQQGKVDAPAADQTTRNRDQEDVMAPGTESGARGFDQAGFDHSPVKFNDFVYVPGGKDSEALWNLTYGVCQDLSPDEEDELMDFCDFTTRNERTAPISTSDEMTRQSEPIESQPTLKATVNFGGWHELIGYTELLEADGLVLGALQKQADFRSPGQIGNQQMSRDDKLWLELGSRSLEQLEYIIQQHAHLPEENNPGNISGLSHQHQKEFLFGRNFRFWEREQQRRRDEWEQQKEYEEWLHLQDQQSQSYTYQPQVSSRFNLPVSPQNIAPHPAGSAAYPDPHGAKYSDKYPNQGYLPNKKQRFKHYQPSSAPRYTSNPAVHGSSEFVASWGQQPAPYHTTDGQFLTQGRQECGGYPQSPVMSSMSPAATNKLPIPKEELNRNFRPPTGRLEGISLPRLNPQKREWDDTE